MESDQLNKFTKISSKKDAKNFPKNAFVPKQKNTRKINRGLALILNINSSSSVAQE